MIAAVVGLVLFLLLQVSKKTKVPTQVYIVGFAIVGGIGYTLFKQFLPVEMQESVVSFVSTAFASSWFLYEILYKPGKAINNAMDDATDEDGDVVPVHGVQ